KVSNGVGVEIMVPVESPNVEKIEMVKRAKVRQGKLYFVREKSAKSMKMKYKDLAAVAKVEEEPVQEEIKETSEDNKAEDNKAEDNKAEDNKAEDNKAEDNKAEDNKAEDNKAEDNKA